MCLVKFAVMYLLLKKPSKHELIKNWPLLKIVTGYPFPCCSTTTTQYQQNDTKLIAIFHAMKIINIMNIDKNLLQQNTRQNFFFVYIRK